MPHISRTHPNQEALDAVYLFSPHSMLNLRSAMVPTATLVPRIDSVDPRRWKVVGVWKKRVVASSGDGDNDDDGGNNSSGDDGSISSGDEDDEESILMSQMRRGNRRTARRDSQRNRGGIHDMDLDAGMPMLGGRAEGMDLENVSPVRYASQRAFHPVLPSSQANPCLQHADWQGPPQTGSRRGWQGYSTMRRTQTGLATPPSTGRCFAS